MYETTQETSTRLNGTVVLYEDGPRFVEGVDTDPDGKIQIHTLLLPLFSGAKRLYLDDPKLNYKYFRTGYVNTVHGASWAHRVPARGRFKQGLCKDNVHFTSPMTAMGERRRIEFQRELKMPGLRDMLLGKYPSISEAAARLRAQDAPPSMAFAPNFALLFHPLRDDFALEYKGEQVAFGPGNYEFKLASKFQYLKEVMQANGLKVR